MRRISLSKGFFLPWILLLSCASMQEALFFGGAVLCHEAGHLVAMRAFGVRPNKVLIGAGGAKIHIAEPYLPYRKELIIFLAGPLANLFFAAAAWLVFFLRPPSEKVLYFLFCNAMLAVLNLLPIEGLDGGKALLCVLLWLCTEEVARKICRGQSLFFLTLLTAVSILLFISHGYLSPIVFCLILWAEQEVGRKKKNRFT